VVQHTQFGGIPPNWYAGKFCPFFYAHGSSFFFIINKDFIKNKLHITYYIPYKEGEKALHRGKQK
jgi:hypothetical protein